MGNTSQVLLHGHKSQLKKQDKYEDNDIVLLNSRRGSRLLESITLDHDFDGCHRTSSSISIYSSICSPSHAGSRDSDYPGNALYPVYNESLYLSAAGDDLDMLCLEQHLASLHESDERMSQGPVSHINQSDDASKSNNSSDGQFYHENLAAEIAEMREKFRHTLDVVSNRSRSSCSMSTRDLNEVQSPDIHSPSLISIETYSEIPSEKLLYRSMPMSRPKRFCYVIEESKEDE